MRDVPVDADHRRDRDLEAERSLLGAVLVQQAQLDVALEEGLTVEDFYHAPHPLIFRAMLALHEHRSPIIDYVSVKNELDRRGDLEPAGGPAYLSSLQVGMLFDANVRYWVGLVQEKTRLRELHKVFTHGRAAVEGDHAVSAVIIEQAEADLYRLRRGGGTSWATQATVVEEARRVLDEVMTQPRGHLRGRPTGVRELDAITGGFKPGEIVVIGARTSMGKTALLVHLLLAQLADTVVAVFTLEMKQVQLVLREAANHARVSLWMLMSGYASVPDQQRVAESLGELAPRRVFWDENALQTSATLRQRLRYLTRTQGPLGLVLLDYLQLVESLPGHRPEMRAAHLAAVSRSLVQMAHEFNVPIVVLSQVSRAAEQTKDHRPTLAHLRESGAIEQDADVVLLLHRPGRYEKDKPELANVVEVIVAKNRNGPGQDTTITLTWDAGPMRFVEEGAAADV